MPVAKKSDTFYTRDWLNQIDIDYFAAFVKVYIPFNSWMNEHMQGESDRTKINRMKDSDNKLRSKMISLLKAEGQEGEAFRNAVGSLHTALENAALSNNGEEISCKNVYMGPNREHDKEVQRYGLSYHAHYDENTKQTILTIRSRKGDVVATLMFNEYPSKEEVLAHSVFASLEQNKKDMLVTVFQQANPRIMKSLLSQSEHEYVMCGSVKMIKAENLAAGLIEVIYNLRNALFHGIIAPTHEANRVYGMAYQVLYPLIKAMV